MSIVVVDWPTNVVPFFVVAEEKIVTYKPLLASALLVALAISRDWRYTVEFWAMPDPEETSIWSRSKEKP